MGVDKEWKTVVVSKQKLKLVWKLVFRWNGQRCRKTGRSVENFLSKVHRKREKCAPWGVESKHINIKILFLKKKNENSTPSSVYRCCNCTCRRRIHNTQAPTHTIPCTLQIHLQAEGKIRRVKLNCFSNVVLVQSDADWKGFSTLTTTISAENFASQSNKVCRRSRHLKSYESFRLDWMCVVKLKKLGKEILQQFLHLMVEKPWEIFQKKQNVKATKSRQKLCLKWKPKVKIFKPKYWKKFIFSFVVKRLVLCTKSEKFFSSRKISNGVEKNPETVFLRIAIRLLEDEKQ